MGWLEREWRVIVSMMSRRVGPKNRPFGEVFAYAIALGLATVWIIVRLNWVMAVG